MLFLFCLSGEEAAGGLNVLATRGTQGACQTVGVEVVLEGTYGFGATGAIGCERRGMEAYEIDTATQTVEQTQQLVSMGYAVVDAVEHGVFERYASLPFPVVFAQHSHNVGYRVRLFGRHEAQPLSMERVMEAHRDMATALLDETTQAWDDAYRRDGDALRAPGQPPRLGKYTCGA